MPHQPLCVRFLASQPAFNDSEKALLRTEGMQHPQVLAAAANGSNVSCNRSVNRSDERRLRAESEPKETYEHLYASV